MLAPRGSSVLASRKPTQLTRLVRPTSLKATTLDGERPERPVTV